MTAILERPITRERLFVWVMHRFSEVFEHHAILKGGLVLRLLNSERLTNDADFVFVPFASKIAILPRIEAVLRELEDAELTVVMHSKMMRARLSLDDVSIEIECSVAQECRSIPMATAAMAAPQGQPSQIVRVMEPQVALAHKLAAWNERRLIRDLYDAYFLRTRLSIYPDLVTLQGRLDKVESRRPELRRTRRMPLARFVQELEETLTTLDDAAVDEELGGLLRAQERAGLSYRVRAALHEVTSQLQKVL